MLAWVISPRFLVDIGSDRGSHGLSLIEFEACQSPSFRTLVRDLSANQVDSCTREHNCRNFIVSSGIRQTFALTRENLS